MEELIGLVNSGNLTGETLTHVKAQLDQRKQRGLAIRIGVIMQRIMQSRIAKKLNTDLLDQIKTAFEKDLEKIRHYRDEETVSKWALESSLPTSVDSTSAIETPLPIIADVVRSYIELTQAIKAEEVSYLESNINLLTRNRELLITVLDEAKALEETSQRNEMIQSLEQDIADTTSFIQREQDRLTRLEA